MLVLAALLLLGAGGRPLYAQDTTAGTVSDTVAGQPADTAADTAAGQVGLRPDTLAPDTTARDTTAPPAPPPPVDSVLAAACGESSGLPPDLLTVVFRPTATAEEREAVAREVGGTLLGPSHHQAPGAWYLHVPRSGLDPTVANRLILLAPVLEVGGTRCPS